MDTLVFGYFTIGQLLIAAGVVVVCVFVGKKLFKKEKESPHTQQVQCGCGWQGRVSVHAGRCPKCNTPIGRQMAR